ncbi:MAG: SDR family NAD(P)-dependent oxidoreductase [Alphaproteobacteria bacterium]|nr:SDR family NAD(P)-dependent oxidoreductase [Alphaproteobacteria bacterium]
METHGLIVMGAAGALGAFVRASAEAAGAAQAFFFDKLQTEDGVRKCDLADGGEIVSALEAIPFEACDRWRLLIASGVYDGAGNGPASWERIKASLEVNLVGAVHFATGIAEKLRQAGKPGRIVIVSSAAASVGSCDIGYGVAKAGLNGLVRSLSKQLASCGITSIGVAPGLFDSPMSAAQDEDRRNDAIRATHLRRPMGLDEVGSCTLYALFSAPDALTGTFLNVNGGQAA